MKAIPSVTFTEINQSQVPPISLVGAHGLITQTLFGPVDKPYEITSVQSFLDTFGGPGVASPNFAQIRRALSRGVTLWIQRLINTAASAASVLLDTSLVTVTAKEFGSWANGALTVRYTPLLVGVNGVPGTNQLQVTYSKNANLNETWQSNSLAGLITAVNAGSQMVVLSTTTGFTEPASSIVVPIALATGSDGAFVSQVTQDAAVAALFTDFNNITQIDSLSAFGSNSIAHFANLSAYVTQRADIMGIFEIDPTITPDAAIALATTLAATPSQNMAVYYSSSLTAYSPEDGAVVSGGCLADVLAVWAVSDTIAGNVYLAPAGGRRGKIPNVQNFASNLLTPANLLKANRLVALGVNIVGSDTYFGPVVWGAQTFANGGTAFDAINVRRSINSLRNQLTPIFRSEEFQPMNPISWRDAYTKSAIVLDKMVSDSAIYPGWVYIGDQESSVTSDAKYNLPLALANGLYRVKLSVVPVGYIYAINIEMDVNNLLTLFSTSQAAV